MRSSSKSARTASDRSSTRRRSTSGSPGTSWSGATESSATSSRGTEQGTTRGNEMPLLFSYGTLQKEDVQLSTFGRQLKGFVDEIVGFEQALFEVKDPAFVAASGKAFHAIVSFNGREESRVKGTVFEVTDE